ncbi:Arabinose efflux permease [Nocardioides sp. J9]|uniref:MFS transporter n=1 Tax=Nocardioides sp. J9 TaxID=935844 RepID=UPI0011ABE6BD|nr:MFS transporter [Nocardioides sp. J9]TWH00547.1 Arabinose efflux permease [Nocardioides sp. J9]
MGGATRTPLVVVLGLVVLAAFVALERRSDGAFLDLRLFRNRVFSGACVATALASAAYFGVLVYLSLFLQTTQDFTAAETGLLYLPTILPYMAVSPVAGRLADRFPGPVVPAVGCAVLALGMVLLAGVQHGAGMLDVTPALVVMGAGSGPVLTPLTKAGLDQVGSGRSGMASGVLQTVRPLGVTAGVTLLGVPVADAVDATAFRSVALLAASLAAAAAVASAGLLRRPR